MGSSMCPHLVQEYFERVSEILVTYRPQILKQVDYDKISENLVLRGAVRQEEHERIDRCDDFEGRVSQMLVVIQNRMWGLENLLAAFMEEHISSWLTEEMFRAYMEHLVHPLKKLQETPRCQCVLMSNSILYRGWIKALKSLDTLILKTGNSLGFMKQSLYPTENMLTFLSEKLAEYTGGDSKSCQDELVPYGFAPNASGEVQVAELEEDDFNDLISLSETLSIAYPSNQEEIQGQGNEVVPYDIMNKLEPEVIQKSIPIPSQTIKGFPILAKPVTRKSPNSKRNRTSVIQSSPNESKSKRQPLFKETQPQNESNESSEKLQKQRQLIERLAAPKQVSLSDNSQSRLRHSRSENNQTSSTPTTKSSRGAQLKRSTSLSTPSPCPSSTSVKSPTSSTPQSNNSQIICSSVSVSAAGKSDRNSTPGKATGFVRSKSVDGNNPKIRTGRLSPKSRPTAVAKPNPKTERGNLKADESKKAIGVATEKKPSIKGDNNSEDNQKGHSVSTTTSAKASECIDPDMQMESSPVDNEVQPCTIPEDDYEDLEDVLPEMSSLFLCNTILASEEQHAKNLGYYQLNFDNE